jgi:hypothetical protein
MTDIRYFADLYADFEELARSQPPTRATRLARVRRSWPLLAALAVAIFVLSVVFVPRLIDRGASQSGSASPAGSGITITASSTPNPPPTAGRLLFWPTLTHPLPLAHRMSLAAASTEFGQRLALSTIPGMARDDVGPIFGNPALARETGQAGVAVTYPSVGAVVIYSRPAPEEGAANYRRAVKQSPRLHMSFLTLDGTPALYIPATGQSAWGQNAVSLSFVKSGIQVTVIIPGATKRQIITVADSIASRT